jgi:peptidoglycan/xylan/chitin deacetylase (PgdA/CDA1 family)
MTKYLGLILIIAISISCDAFKNDSNKPKIAFSFDDGSTKDRLTYNNSDWNSMIRKQLKDNQIQAIWFVAGRGMDNDKGKQLMQKWSDAGHIISNHTYSHYNYHDSLMTCEKFIEDILKCDSLISGYENFKKIFRFPYLKGGNTIEKRDCINAYLQQKGYEHGWVTIDASDWYINMRLMSRLKQYPDADISGFREYYINHIFERAQYYNELSVEINNRQVKHTLLLHFNLTSALFLNDLIEKFRKEGWIIVDYNEAIKDPIYSEQPVTIPAEQSLIWMQAKQIGGFELRYPGEDGAYEKIKMDSLGL